MEIYRLSSAIKELGSRSSAVLSAYRDWSRRMPPGPASRLTASMAEQRLELSKALGEISMEIGAILAASPDIEIEFESGISPAALIDGKSGSGESPADPKDLLKAMAEIESGEHELLAALAGALLPLSSVLAERLAGEAASARKRSNWARDHLDLLGMG